MGYKLSKVKHKSSKMKQGSTHVCRCPICDHLNTVEVLPGGMINDRTVVDNRCEHWHAICGDFTYFSDRVKDQYER